VQAINRGLEESGVMVLVLTPAAAASPWVQMETNVAIELERGGEMAFIPLLLERGRYPGLWRAYQWVMGDDDYAAGLAALRARLAGGEKLSFSEKTQFPETQKSEAEIQVTAAPPVIFPAPPPPSSPALQDRRIHEKTGIELIRIPAGPFLYGEGENQKTIDLPEFWIGRCPVTNAQYKHFLDANPQHRIPYYDADWAKPYNWDQKSRTYPVGKADHPVVIVSWNDAQAFCHWAELILPTEEQWEKAARETDGRKWPWGDAWAANRANTSEAGVGGTTPVGKYSPQGDSPYGCADMAGNVWEWMGSWYDEKQTYRVLRGGSWNNDQSLARVSIRIYPTPAIANLDLGLRVAAPTGSGY
jgi:formylglycine-generating enzyme required for sulfatase activity